MWWLVKTHLPLVVTDKRLWTGHDEAMLGWHHILLLLVTEGSWQLSGSKELGLCDMLALLPILSNHLSPPTLSYSTPPFLWPIRPFPFLKCNLSASAPAFPILSINLQIHSLLFRSSLFCRAGIPLNIQFLKLFSHPICKTC